MTPAISTTLTGDAASPPVSMGYSVGNPVPPWKSSLDAMCDALDLEGTALPLLTRRRNEDCLSDEVYAAVPFPERQLLALAHSLIARSVIDEAALAERMAVVRARLEGH